MLSEKNLYVKENLIKSRYQLLNLTREFVQRNFFQFVWTRGKKICRKLPPLFASGERGNLMSLLKVNLSLLNFLYERFTYIQTLVASYVSDLRSRARHICF